ncbi:formate dehydrogenase accessory sulfurtransferase FdhD [Horticoccus sp. 23ND18S-11]|uniref:formate dehydrogenase accessory sulfurtransferase FdhD n=1 Tax=Horticoccus sp. 23ND18S-11 TaxID=3391832 RepID=UPI0039C9A788
MSLAQSLRAKPITRLEGTDRTACDDLLAVEEPLEIRVGGRSVAVVMRTPGHDRELAAGFLVTEGIVRHRDDVLDIVRCTNGDAAAEASRGNIVDVLLAPGASVDLDRLTRHVFTSSSCGICSKATIDAVRAQFAPLVPTIGPAREVIAALPEKLHAVQAGFAASGGLHASALFTWDGTLEQVREDVGRHNALDKVIGHAFFAEQLPLAQRILLVSGRVSFELMQKALAAGIPCVAAISAPTTAAVEFAVASGQTLVGFVRASTRAGGAGSRMNVYAGTLAE